MKIMHLHLKENDPFLNRYNIYFAKKSVKERIKNKYVKGVYVLWRYVIKDFAGLYWYVPEYVYGYSKEWDFAMETLYQSGIKQVSYKDIINENSTIR